MSSPLILIVILILISPHSPMPAHAVQPVVPVVTSISGPLGLADVSIDLPAAQTQTPVLRFRPAASNGELNVSMHRAQSPRASTAPLATTRWTARVLAGSTDDPAAAPLQFSIRLGPDTTLGPFDLNTNPPERLRTPDWSKGLAWYQIFPERFRDGEPRNNPRGPETQPRAWNSSWSLIGADELEAARARHFDSGGAVSGSGRRRNLRGSILTDRRFGGDLQGVVQQLDHLQSLGINAIYLNPVFHAFSSHKYDATDFRHIDPTLAWPGEPPDWALRSPLPGETEDPATWTWTPADRYVIDVLIPEVHRRGMKIVFDGVWNHVGTRFWAFDDCVRRGSASPYKSWFDCQFAPEDATAALYELRRLHPDLHIEPGSLQGWKSWNGRNGSLPTFTRTADGRFPDAVEAHLFAVTRRWMDPNNDGDPSDGIDGWRLDVAPDVPMPFWERWRSHVKSINPDAVLIGEVWQDAARFFDGKAFDAQMNYPAGMPIVRWLAQSPNSSAAKLASALTQAFQHAPQVDLTQMNLLDSHDTPRLLTMLANHELAYSDVDASSLPRRPVQPTDAHRDLAVVAVALAAALPGSPTIYYGDEWGMTGANDPDCRKPLPWPDLATPADPLDRPESSMPARFAQWLRLRADPTVGPVLRFGSVEILAGDNPDVCLVVRRLNDLTLLIVANRGSAPVDPVPLLAERGIRPEQPPKPVGPRSAIWWIADSIHR